MARNQHRRVSRPQYRKSNHDRSSAQGLGRFWGAHRGKQAIGVGLIVLAGLWYGGYNPPTYVEVMHHRRGNTEWQIGEYLVPSHELGKRRELPELQAYALKLANRDRQLNGLAPLQEDPLLSLTAQRHAEDMLKRRFYGHVNPDGQDPSDRFQAVGGQQGAGENIAQQRVQNYMAPSYARVEEFQIQWMFSEGHRQNLLTADYETFGYGIAAAPTGNEIYAVQLFSFTPD